MQSSPYSVYNEHYNRIIEDINDRCGRSLPTAIPPSPVLKKPRPPAICVSGETFTTRGGERCAEIALARNVASAALFTANSNAIVRCDDLQPHLVLCLPLNCARLHRLQPTDNCTSIENANDLRRDALRRYNNWINMECSNLHTASQIHGRVLCLAPQAGTFTPGADIPPGVTPGPSPGSGYTGTPVSPPVNSTVPADTTKNCGKWYTVVEGDTCAGICLGHAIPAHLFWAVNPSLSPVDCNFSLSVGTTYCAGPVYGCDQETSTGTTTTSSAVTSSPAR
jgi:hypothetical protein